MPGFRAISETIASEDTPRSSIGGSAILPERTEVPSCRNCGNELLLFLQFDIDESWTLPFKAQSHLVVFMCPKCNEIPFFDAYEDGKLPNQFWDMAEGHFFAVLLCAVGVSSFTADQQMDAFRRGGLTGIDRSRLLVSSNREAETDGEVKSIQH